MSINCQQDRCPKSYTGTDSEARALGWMIWEGTTLGGAPISATYCPGHAGRTEEQAKAAETGHDAHCFTCGEDATDDTTFLGTEEDAEAWADEHVCEPDVTIRRPKVKTGATA